MCYWVRLSTLYMAGHCGHGCPGYQRHNHTLGNTPTPPHTLTTNWSPIPGVALVCTVQAEAVLYRPEILLRENFCPQATACRLPAAITTCVLHGTEQLVAGSSRNSSMGLTPLGVTFS